MGTCTVHLPHNEADAVLELGRKHGVNIAKPLSQAMLDLGLNFHDGSLGALIDAHHDAPVVDVALKAAAGLVAELATIVVLVAAAALGVGLILRTGLQLRLHAALKAAVLISLSTMLRHVTRECTSVARVATAISSPAATAAPSASTSRRGNKLR